MADIDKSLPNVGSPQDLPENDIQEEVVTDEVVETGGPVEITDEEDGGATIDFDPSQTNIDAGEDHFANLNELLPEDDTDAIGNQLQSDYMEYKLSRAEWERTYITGLELLGFKYENRTQPFQGASGATHPVLAEAVTQFQALAYKELLPADGPVRTQVMGISSPQKEQQAQRVKNFMNYQIMDQMSEYEPEFDQMLFYLPLSGSTFKKVYNDPLKQRAVSSFVHAEDLIVPYGATDLTSSPRITHRLTMDSNEVRKLQLAGFYRDIDLPSDSEDSSMSEVEESIDDIQGVHPSGSSEELTLYEVHTSLDIEGFEDLGQDLSLIHI